MENQEVTYSYRDILGFYLPLFLNVGIITLTAPLLNFGVSKAVEPGKALAAFGAAFSLTIIYNSFIYTSLKVYNSHLRDRESFCRILRVYLLLGSVGSLLFAAIGLTETGNHLFSFLFGLRADTAAHAKEWMLWSSPVPVLVAVRCALQGVTTVYRNTLNNALGTILRMVAVLTGVLVLIVLYPHRPGMASGAAFSLAGLVETLFLLSRTGEMRTFSTPTAVAAYDQPLTVFYILRFSAPLWISSIAWTGSFPIINYFIGNTASPEAGLAGFNVLRSLNVLLNSPLNSLMTVVLILGNAASLLRVRTLGIVLGCALTILSYVFSLPSVHLPLLGTGFNLSGQALSWAGTSTVFFMFFPVLLLVRFYYEGLFMRLKAPKVLGMAGGVRLGLLVLSGAVLTDLFPGVNGVMLGMVLIIIASASDALFTAVAYEISHRKAGS
ncbi:MAG TPA: hypothetical protein DHV36_16570 [Desulfobacteraceae bacterium]|nr:hypothetical protein [Desulfobacteraceae bacterium]